MTRFPNKAGDHRDTDTILINELEAAGITIWNGEPVSDDLRLMLRKQSGEVKTSIVGFLHGWEFKRAWYYWTAQGPGIDVVTAEELHCQFGQEVRVGGDGNAPSPREQYKGLACGFYHIDSVEGLKALADCITSLVEKSNAVLQKSPKVNQKLRISEDKMRRNNLNF